MVTQKPATQRSALLEWFKENQRPVPWRLNRDPYRIWISETMLQQTTTTAVIPFFERFLNRFPNLKALAEAPEGDVVEAWAGLGYYSRARNLRKAAELLQARGGFPRTHNELINFPGIGPYTARAIASQAFEESVGVVDGNVIRVLSRFHGQKWKWWENKIRESIQTRADEWVKGVSANLMNQALMELGATICTPQSPACLLCPLRKGCVAFKKQIIGELPLPKPRREREFWLWNVAIVKKSGKILIVKNSTTPFLKGQWLLPGSAKRLSAKPKAFQFRHSITHHDIFVTLDSNLPKIKKSETKWVPAKEIRRFIPASLVHKALQAFDRASAADLDKLQTPRRNQTRRA
jgi:A/G-specific adenine glycosylase